MLAPDVTVPVYAFRETRPEREGRRRWRAETVPADAAFGLSELVPSGVLRVVTHPYALATPTPLEIALTVTGERRARPGGVLVQPGPRHRGLLERPCASPAPGAAGSPDACSAARAIESGCEWVTTDRDHSRVAGVRRRHPPGGARARGHRPLYRDAAPAAPGAAGVVS